MERMTTDEFAQRMTDLLNNGRWKAAFCRCLDMSPEHLRRMFAQSKPVPIYMQACLEFLELVPAKRWPHRWAELKDAIRAAEQCGDGS